MAPFAAAISFGGLRQVAELYHEKVIDDITDVRDESDRDGMRIVI